MVNEIKSDWLCTKAFERATGSWGGLRNPTERSTNHNMVENRENQGIEQQGERTI